MKSYSYQNNLINKKQLRQLLAWSFSTYNVMQSCSLADELKYLGFQYASQAGISISLEDLKIPFIKEVLIEKATQEITDAEKVYLKGRVTNVERFQKIIDTWSLTSEALKNQIVYYFKNYDPLNSVYIMAFSGARGNLSQVRQLVGMRGLMSDPSGEIMNLPIKKNFREGLTITDYLMSGYGARKGIVDTALKTANSGYLTRRLIDVSQDILIREKNCRVHYSILHSINSDQKSPNLDSLLGCILNKSITDPKTKSFIAKSGTQITSSLIQTCIERKIQKFYLRSSLTCSLYRAVCQNCYGWDLATENLIDLGEAVGILAGQSIGEPGTQLTMRTFHTGGTFTAATRQQILSPITGVIQFYKSLKTSVLRTNRGEEVLVTQNSGFVVLIPENQTNELVRLEVLPNTILFPKNNQYVSKDAVIGELINTNQQIRIEIKPILSYEDGEVFVPRLRKKKNIVNNNKFLWVLFGKLFHSPNSSFLNLHPDYKVNQQSYITRSKLVSQIDGNVTLFNNKKNLHQRLFQITNIEPSHFSFQIRKLDTPNNFNTHLLELATLNYFVNVKKQDSNEYIQRTLDGQLGTLITNKFKTLVGGQLFYDSQNLSDRNDAKQFIDYLQRIAVDDQCESLNQYSTMSWLSEEVHNVDCKPDRLLVEEGDLISVGSEIIPGIFSKISGLVSLTKQRLGLIQTILIKKGLIYEGKAFQKVDNQIYYPGERLFSNITIKNLVICESIFEKKSYKLLVKPLTLYEVPRFECINSKRSASNFKIRSKKLWAYKPNQSIRANKNINLILDSLVLEDKKFKNINCNIKFFNNKKKKNLYFKIIEKLQLTNYIVPDLKYRNLQSCLVVQEQQFISRYMVLGYLETLTMEEIEIVKLKMKEADSKEILLISNNDCITVAKHKLTSKKLNDLVTDGPQIRHMGKIIIENKDNFTIQKGQPYFFPNCRGSHFSSKAKLQYKILVGERFKPSKKVFQKLAVQYCDMTKIVCRNKAFRALAPGSKVSAKIEFSNFFMKKNRKLYSCLTPQLFKKFHVNDIDPIFHIQKVDEFRNFGIPKSPTLKKAIQKEKIEKHHRLKRTVLMKKSNLSSSQLISPPYQLSLLEFDEHPFKKSSKAIGLYSITEDYFEQDQNSVFCQNGEFIETGTTVGLLNLEKAITGDIVQGLPRIEEILEARKKNLKIKRIPMNQKKGLLTQVTNLDPNFDFKKLGFPLMENNKINPHKLLKAYFNYYGVRKLFFCDRQKKITQSRLVNNYDGSYKSFKKVQLFILHSVQAVYYSQGVNINDKHLEVIIKQMTTKVLITSEGNAPLLRREVVDLYHIERINKIIALQIKKPACYVPFLLGITKAALNNPSFISAASFQETTRVLTKAAIEGRMDWLRGLKENIITGHLIPAGTGSPDYSTGSRKKKMILPLFKNNSERTKPRQVY